MTPAPRMRTVDEVYGSAFARYDEFEQELDRSLAPCGFEHLFDLVAELHLASGSVALDVGCREAFHCIELSRRYGFAVHGIDPVSLHLQGATRAAEAGRLWPVLGVHAGSTDAARFEAAIAAGGLTVDRCIELHGEWRERSEEDGIAYRSSRQLLHASRLLRNRRHYEENFGTAAYDAMLGNSLWGVYQMIGKLNPRVYVLSAGLAD